MDEHVGLQLPLVSQLLVLSQEALLLTGTYRYGKKLPESELVYKAVDEDLAKFGGSSMMTNMICIGTIMAVDRWSRRSGSGLA